MNEQELRALALSSMFKNQKKEKKVVEDEKEITEKNLESKRIRVIIKSVY